MRSMKLHGLVKEFICNEKNHYLLDKSRARTQETDVCWIFFGMMTANASIVAQRIEKQKRMARAA